MTGRVGFWLAGLGLLCLAAVPAHAQEAGRYQVVAANQALVMVDTHTGRSWAMVQGAKWRPMAFLGITKGEPETFLPSLSTATTPRERWRKEGEGRRLDPRGSDPRDKERQRPSLETILPKVLKGD